MTTRGKDKWQGLPDVVAQLQAEAANPGISRPRIPWPDEPLGADGARPVVHSHREFDHQIPTSGPAPAPAPGAVKPPLPSVRARFDRPSSEPAAMPARRKPPSEPPPIPPQRGRAGTANPPADRAKSEPTDRLHAQIDEMISDWSADERTGERPAIALPKDRTSERPSQRAADRRPDPSPRPAPAPAPARSPAASRATTDRTATRLPTSDTTSGAISEWGGLRDYDRLAADPRPDARALGMLLTLACSQSCGERYRAIERLLGDVNGRIDKLLAEPDPETRQTQRAALTRLLDRLEDLLASLMVNS